MINPLQAVAQTSPAQPALPVPATPIAPVAPVVAGPRVATDYRTLQSRRSELSRQLNSTADRRQDVLKELRQAPQGAERAGLEARLGLLDGRILQIERDIQLNGLALAETPRSLAQDAGTTEPASLRDRFNGNETAWLAANASIFVLAPLAFAVARRIWRGAPSVHMHRDTESDRRLERIEQAVDAIAIEIERISEGLRFQNKLLGEGQGIPLYGFGQPHAAEPVGAGVRGAIGDSGGRGIG